MRPRKSHNRIFFALVLLCIAAPGFAMVKAVAIVTFWGYCVAVDGFKKSSTIWFLSVLANLLAWSMVAEVHMVSQADMINQCSRILIFFMVLSIGVHIARNSKLSSTELDTLIFRVAMFAMILKIVILTLVLGGWYSLEEVQKYIGFETVSDNIGLGLERLQFPSDIATLFLLPCYVGGKSKIKDIAFLLSITVVVFLSFSRFLFVGYLLCLIVRYIWIRKLDLISQFSAVVILILCTIFSANLALRFSGEGTTASDSVRTEQIRHLNSVTSSFPILGTGIGSSANGYTRSDTMPFSYEVEWNALTMQFGFLGITWFCINLLAVLFVSLKAGKNILPFAIVFVVWIASGFTNPYVTSLGSAFGFSILIFRSLQIENTNPQINM